MTSHSKFNHDEAWTVGVNSRTGRCTWWVKQQVLMPYVAQRQRMRESYTQ